MVNFEQNIRTLQSLTARQGSAIAEAEIAFAQAEELCKLVKRLGLPISKDIHDARQEARDEITKMGNHQRNYRRMLREQVYLRGVFREMTEFLGQFK